MTDTSIKELQMQVAEIKPFNAITNPSVHPAQKEAVIDIISKFKEKFLKGNEQARWYIDACGHQKYGLEIHEEHSSHFRIKNERYGDDSLLDSRGNRIPPIADVFVEKINRSRYFFYRWAQLTNNEFIIPNIWSMELIKRNEMIYAVIVVEGTMCRDRVKPYKHWSRGYSNNRNLQEPYLQTIMRRFENFGDRSITPTFKEAITSVRKGWANDFPKGSYNEFNITRRYLKHIKAYTDCFQWFKGKGEISIYGSDFRTTRCGRVVMLSVGRSLTSEYENLIFAKEEVKGKWEDNKVFQSPVLYPINTSTTKYVGNTTINYTFKQLTPATVELTPEQVILEEIANVR